MKNTNLLIIKGATWLASMGLLLVFFKFVVDYTK